MGTRSVRRARFFGQLSRLANERVNDSIRSNKKFENCVNVFMQFILYKITERVLSVLLICVKLLLCDVKFENQGSRARDQGGLPMNAFYLDSCLLLTDSSNLFHQMPQRLDHGMELMQGLSGKVDELDKQNSFHDIVCFAIQICPRPQKSVRDIRRTAGNRR